MNKLYFLFSLAFLYVFSLAAQIAITDASLVAGTTYNWTNDNEYLLDGLVYLEAGGVLNIQAGTVVKFKNSPSTGDNTSALVISKNAQIFATGTAEQPIVFTAEDDDLTDEGDFRVDDRGEWGGLLILGNATIARPGGTDNIEGIDADEVRAAFGGTDNMDNSGVLRYVSIRHGGAALAPGDEINGLTLGGVGAGTEIDYVEVIANLDDGIEFFGGTVDVKHAAVSFCGDDAYDYDFGYRGRGQYWFSMQGPDETTGRAGEHDGANPDNQAPFSQPTIYNATYIGLGADVTNLPGGDADDFAILLRDNAGGFYNNSIFTDFPARAVAIEDRDEEDAFDRLQAGDLAFNNNIFFGFGSGTTAADLFIAVDTDENLIAGSSATVANIFTANTNELTDPQLSQMDRSTGVDPRPIPGGNAATGAPASSDDFFDAVSYYGAFAPNTGSTPLWMDGWTAISEYGIVDMVTSVNTQFENGFSLDAPAPNPADQATQIQFELPATANVSVTVIDALGRPVLTALNNERLLAGMQTINLDTRNLANGFYVLLLNVEGTQLKQQLVVSH